MVRPGVDHRFNPIPPKQSITMIKNKFTIQTDAFAKALKREGGIRIAKFVCGFEPGEQVLGAKIATESKLSSTRAAEVVRMLEEAGIISRRRAGNGNNIIVTVKDHDFRNFVRTFK